jgi:hypothetical protein
MVRQASYRDLSDVMRGWGVVFADISISILSKKMILSIISVFLLCIIGIHKYVVFDHLQSMDVLYFLELLTGLSMFKKLLIIVAGMPFVIGFCQDWNSQYVRFLVIRSGIKRYICSKILVCAASSLLAVIIGMALFLLLISCFMPFINPEVNAMEGNAFRSLFSSGHYATSALLHVFGFALGNTFWILCGFALSESPRVLRRLDSLSPMLPARTPFPNILPLIQRAEHIL